MHDIKANFDIILGIIKPISQHLLNKNGNLIKKGPEPLMPDIEIVALSLLMEYMGIDSEKNFFVRIKESTSPGDFPLLPERSRFNRRRRNLFALSEECRRHMAQALLNGEDTFVVDTCPLETVRFARAQRSSSCRDAGERHPAFGYCASKKKNYYGFKFSGMVGLNGVFAHFDLLPANTHDIQYLQDVRNQFIDINIIGDLGFLSEPLQLELFDQNGIFLHTPMRTNQKDRKPFPKPLSKARKRIETCFSQLQDQFNLWRNRALTFWGLKTRTIAKIAAMTLVQYINKFVLNREIGHIKQPILY